MLSAPSMTLREERNEYDEMSLMRKSRLLLSKYCVFAVKMSLLRVCDKELRFVGVGTSVCHCDHSTSIELKVRING